MKHNVVKTEFTRDIHQFLIAQGYSHIFSQGVDPADSNEESPDYILIPIRPGDSRIETPTGIIEVITDTDVLEMIAGDEFIHFVVEVPVKEFQVFLDQNSTWTLG
jgi:hypothetical protein